MAHKKSLLAGIAIGAGAALGVREVIRRIRRKGSAERYRGAHAFMEPEGSRTRSYLPNAPEEGYPENLRHAGENLSRRAGANVWTREEEDETSERRYRGADALRRDINAIGFRNRHFDTEFGSESMQPPTPGTVDNTVKPSATLTLGSEAPFITKDI